MKKLLTVILFSSVYFSLFSQGVGIVNTDSATGIITFTSPLNSNVVIGTTSYNFGGTKEDNVIIGQTGGNFQEGMSNICLGSGTGNGAGHLSSCVLMGHSSSHHLDYGERNIFIGEGGGTTITNEFPLTDAIAIGCGAIVNISNGFVLGNNSANIGIGTSTPTQKLQVDATGSTIRFSGIGALPITSPYTFLVKDGNDDLYTQSLGTLLNCSSPNQVLRMDATGLSTTCSNIFDNGTSVGIGTTSPRSLSGTAASLDVNGLLISTSAWVSSDARYKTNVKGIDNALAIVAKLQGVNYDWRAKEYPARHFDGQRQSGYLAQDLEKAYPSAVAKD